MAAVTAILVNSLPWVLPLSGLGVVVHEVGLALWGLGHLPPLWQGSQVHAGVKRTLFWGTMETQCGVIIPV